ncbi:hypothetical protein J8273_8199 [Carpediemonas membranifera]|uniref:Uncharacterized protein n=1 Tax=Carpediemonas membranifera TaxID=201153 RepID=A0A8J6DXH3_9EUKA|nr:hypothetical protein J8273_8199 [Carpediemonas membranifera]|eukprot:KAG9390159.1 hypothetical protein J8273_8199 [Carpediemonas membranifera]
MTDDGAAVYRRLAPDIQDYEEERYIDDLITKVENRETGLGTRFLKLESAIWVFAAVALLFFTRPIPRMYTDPAVPKLYAYIATAAAAVVLGITLYYSVFLNIVKRDSNYLKRSEFLFTVAAGAVIVAFFAFLRCLWPLYGWLTPVLIFICFMAVLHGSSFLPWKDNSGGKPEEEVKATQ